MINIIIQTQYRGALIGVMIVKSMTTIMSHHRDCQNALQLTPGDILLSMFYNVEMLF